MKLESLKYLTLSRRLLLSTKGVEFLKRSLRFWIRLQCFRKCTGSFEKEYRKYRKGHFSVILKMAFEGMLLISGNLIENGYLHPAEFRDAYRDQNQLERFKKCTRNMAQCSGTFLRYRLLKKHEELTSINSWLHVTSQIVCKTSITCKLVCKFGLYASRFRSSPLVWKLHSSNILGKVPSLQTNYRKRSATNRRITFPTQRIRSPKKRKKLISSLQSLCNIPCLPGCSHYSTHSFVVVIAILTIALSLSISLAFSLKNSPPLLLQ